MDKNGRQKLAPSKRSHPPSHRQEVTKNKSKKEANTRPNSSRIQSEQTKKDSPTQSKKRRSSSPDKNQKSLLKDEECISMRHNLINSNKSRDFEDYDTDHLYLLMDHLHEYSTYCAMNRKYDKGKSSSLLYERVRQEINRRNEGNLAAKGNNLDQDYEDLLQNAEENFQRELEDYDSVTEEKSQELEKKHKKEREEFDHYWQEVAPRKYRKPSPRLIDLMERERRMGITGEFDRAKATKIEVEKLQRIEHSRAQKQLLFDYENAKSKLGKTQSEERESFVNNRQHGREIILSRQSIQLGYLKNRETVLSQRNKEGSPKQEAKHRKSNTMAI
ncbi:hypothetical protein GPJ56_001710 [Histomonas meleagridis]|uniref:uncharacterized protein n=1 Tax=Histomonas meleagridis TaxID=135588 RepID=UPI00355949D8|nr:hypothetical protein GPJ56_001710 [Histomonas meleagridis]KAH0796204.1 hypothetical protein GO595_010097 [Histomonas meleagridis]